MHNPIGFLTVGCSTKVKDEGFSHSNPFGIAADDLITTCGFPEPSSSSTIGSDARRVLLVFMAKEVPFVLWGGPDFARLCIIRWHKKKKKKKKYERYRFLYECVKDGFMEASPSISHGSSLLRSISRITSKSIFSYATFFFR